MANQRTRRPFAAFTLIEILVTLSIIVLLIALILPALSMARESARATTCASGLRQWGTAMRSYLNDHDQHLPREGSNSAQELKGAWYNELPYYVNALPYGSQYEKDGAGLKEAEGYANNWIWHCPTRMANGSKHSETGKNAFHYGMNAVLNGTDTYTPDFTNNQPFTNTRQIADPAHTVFITESNDHAALSPAFSSNPDFEDQIDRDRHSGDSLNVLFLDGRVAMFEQAQLPEPTKTGGVYRSEDPILIWGPFKN